MTVSTDQVGQEAPTTTTRRPGSDGLLPNTGGDIAMPLVLAGLAAGTGAATLLVRRRTNVS
ncbi:MAG: LPXTG cell wall anchor domain-containing protein [Actinobacteria bacterium]|nr:LPXTG cell wall anchor domain-containing protein [Actinomycetota bacterium]